MWRYYHTMQGRAAHGFMSFLANVLRDRRPAHVLVCTDLPHPTFRHALAPRREGSKEGYKAQREGPDATILERLRWSREMIEDVHGIRVMGKRGFEADDLIAAAARFAHEAGMKVVLVALDKDLMQLVSDSCVMWDGKRSIVGPREVVARFGVRPDQVRDYLAIVGDASDNVPGIAGLGPRAAQEILGDFHTLDMAMEAAQFPYGHPLWIRRPSYRKKLKTQTAAAALSRKLVTLAYDCIDDIDFEELRYEAY
jgi:DNA polymerase-1